MTTEAQATRAQKEWSSYAGEPIRFEAISGAYYAFGSELAVLRLKNKMDCGRVGFSQNIGEWYYSIEKMY